MIELTYGQQRRLERWNNILRFCADGFKPTSEITSVSHYSEEQTRLACNRMVVDGYMEFEMIKVASRSVPAVHFKSIRFEYPESLFAEHIQKKTMRTRLPEDGQLIAQVVEEVAPPTVGRQVHYMDTQHSDEYKAWAARERRERRSAKIGVSSTLGNAV